MMTMTMYDGDADDDDCGGDGGGNDDAHDECG